LQDMKATCIVTSLTQLTSMDDVTTALF